MDSIPLRCVDCGGDMCGSVCPGCERRFDSVSGIQCYLSTEDLQSDLFQRYLRNYESIATNDLDQDILPVPYKQAQCRKLFSYCRPWIRGAVLDIGAGQGDFLRRVPHERKLGVDISLGYLARLRQANIPCVLANAENLPFVNTFDLIVMSDVLEHVLSTGRLWQSVVRAARPNARIVVRVPYREDIGVYQDKSTCEYEFVHLRSFDEQTLVDDIQRAGLRITRLHYDGWSLGYPRNRWVQYAFKKRGKLARWWSRHLFGREPKPEVAAGARWPNWLGKLLLTPLEIVAVARCAK